MQQSHEFAAKSGVLRNTFSVQVSPKSAQESDEIAPQAATQFIKIQTLQ
jgi:hypothetical protein